MVSGSFTNHLIGGGLIFSGIIVFSDLLWIAGEEEYEILLDLDKKFDHAKFLRNPNQ